MVVNDDARTLTKRGALTFFVGSPPGASSLPQPPPIELKPTKNPAALACGVFGIAAQRLVMLTGRAEFHVGPALFHQRQVDPGRSQVGQVTAAVDREVFHGLVGNSSSFFLSLQSTQRAE